MTEPLILKFFNSSDSELSKVTFPDDNMDAIKSEAVALLEEYARDPNRRSKDKPSQAKLVDTNGCVVKEFRMTESGAKEVVRGKVVGGKVARAKDADQT
jgi:hypothetical protein